jgi:filamentous hemagglutinin family protein
MAIETVGAALFLAGASGVLFNQEKRANLCGKLSGLLHRTADRINPKP